MLTHLHSRWFFKDCLKIKKPVQHFCHTGLSLSFYFSLLHQHFFYLIVVRQDDGKVVVFCHAEQVASALVVGI